ncbi:MAG: PucR family transcriptional regulator, partial [Pseudomonadota bacterium]
MTNIITRYFDSAKQARAAKHELIHRRGLSVRIIDLFDSADGLAETLTDAHVEPETARAYAERVAQGGAVLLVRATYKPLGVAQTTRDVMREMGAANLGPLTEEVYVKDERGAGLSILTDHPHMLTRRRDPDSTTFHMADWPFPLIIRRKPFVASDVPGHRHMTSAFYPLLMDYTPYVKSIFPRHARMANWPIPLLSKRKPYTRSIFPRHARMANWPIPL